MLTLMCLMCLVLPSCTLFDHSIAVVIPFDRVLIQIMMMTSADFAKDILVHKWGVKTIACIECVTIFCWARF